MVEKGEPRKEVPVIGKDDDGKGDGKANNGGGSDQDEAGSVDLFDDCDDESISDDSDEQEADTEKVLSNKEKACKKILEDFYEYLTSADCGNKDPKASRQAQVQVRSVIQVLDPEMDILEMAEYQKIRDQFLKIHCVNKKYSSRTIKSYLHNLVHFYEFMQSEYPQLFDKDLLAFILSKLKKWIKHYQVEISQQNHRDLKI